MVVAQILQFLFIFLKDIATIRALGGKNLGLSLLQIQFQRKRKNGEMENSSYVQYVHDVCLYK